MASAMIFLGTFVSFILQFLLASQTLNLEGVVQNNKKTKMIMETIKTATLSTLVQLVEGLMWSGMLAQGFTSASPPPSPPAESEAAASSDSPT